MCELQSAIFTLILTDRVENIVDGMLLDAESGFSVETALINAVTNNYQA